MTDKEKYEYYECIIDEYNFFINERTSGPQYNTFKRFVKKHSRLTDFNSNVFIIDDILESDILYFLNMAAKVYFTNISSLEGKMMEYNNSIMQYIFEKIDIQSLFTKKNSDILKTIQSILIIFEEKISQYKKYKDDYSMEGAIYALLLKHYKKYHTKDIEKLFDLYPEYDTAMA